MASRSLSRERREQAREARGAFEVVVDRPWSRRASLWLDCLVVMSEEE
jgi:hypothetical protein